MTGLLISVRNPSEAAAAVRGGAAIIDVKEPKNGSLGAAAPEVWRQVRAAVPAPIPCSAALGELRDLSPHDSDHWGGSLAGYQFAKLGLAGCAGMPAWEGRWKATLKKLPREIRHVAVLYADWQTAAAPAPKDVLSAAAHNQCSALLIDTFDKTHGPLTAHLPIEALQEILSSANSARLTTVLAGSLSPALARLLLPLAPDFLALRGAVCRGSRTDSVDEGLVREFAKMLLSTRDGAHHFSTPTKEPFAA